MITDSIKNDVESRLGKRRMAHTKNVMEKSAQLAREYGANEDEARFIAYVHDMFRDTDDSTVNQLIDKYGLDPNYKNNNALSHGPVASQYIKNEYGMKDDDILNSVRYHTTGRKGMSLQEKIIFLADAIEKDRDYPGVDTIRKEAEKGLNYGVRASLKNTLEHLKQKKRYIHDDTAEAMNYIDEELKGD